MKPRKSFLLPNGSSSFLASLMVASPAFAATVVWDGGPANNATDLGTAPNWSGDVLPNVATPDTAQWNGTAAGALSLVYSDAAFAGAAGNAGINLEITAAQTGAVSLDSGANTGAIRVNNITIAAGAGAFSLGNGTDTLNLTLGGGPSTQTFTNNSSSPASINSDAVFGLGGGGNHLVNFTGSGNWSAAANLAFAAGGQAVLYKTGAGTLTLSGGGAFKEGPTVNGGTQFSAVLKEGLTVINGGTYTNNITTNNGEFVVGGTDAVGTNTKLEMNNAAVLNGIDWLSIGRGNGTGATSSDVTLNNTASISSTNLSGGFDGGNTATAPKCVITLNNSAGITVANTVNIAESANSNITLVLNGTSTFSQTANSAQTRVGMANGSQGTIQVSGGTASFHRDLTIGYGGTGVGKLILDSGTVNSATTVERWLKVGELASSSGQVTVNGGNLNLNTNTDLRFTTNAAAAGTNFVTLNGGAITGYTGNNNGVPSGASVVDLNQASTNAAVNNTFNLNGGILTIGQVITNNDAGTASFKFNGGTLKAAAASVNFFTLGGASQTASVMTGGAIIDSNTFDVTIAQPLLSGVAGDGGLTKQGTGKLTLSGTPSYTGATTVSAGTLAYSAVDFTTGSGITVNGSGAKLVLANAATTSVPITVTNGGLDVHGTVNSVTVANNATNSVSAGNGTNNLMTATSLTFQGAASINVQATGSTADRFIITQALNTSAAGVITVNAVNTLGAWTSGTDYPVIQYSGTFNGSLSHFALAPVAGLNPSQTAQLVNANGAISVRITGESLIWTGAQNSNWTTTAVGGSKNWSYQGNGIEFTTASPVQFDDTANNTLINLAENVSPSAVVFNNDSKDYTLSSTGGFGITGGALVKNGAAKLTITADNSYTGTTVIGGGIVEVSGAGSISDSSSITLADGTELVLNPATADIYSHPINGTGILTKKGTGALTLSGANGITGNIYIEGGTLNLNSAGALGAAPGTLFIEGATTLDNTSGAAVTLTGNRPQNWNADVSFTGTNALNMGTGAVIVGGTGTARTVNVPGAALTVGAVNSGAFDFVKTGAGTLNIAGGNINSTLDLQAGILGTSQDLTVARAAGSGILQNNGLVGTKWTFWAIESDQTFSGQIRNNDGTNTTQLGIVKRGAAKLTLDNNANNATSMLQVENGTLVLNGAGTYGSRNDDNTPRIGTALVGTGATNAVLEIDGAAVNYNCMANADAIAYRSSLSIGNTAGGAGTVRLKSGSLTMYRQLALGNATAFGGLTQTGGTMNVGGFVAMGFTNSPSVMNLKGGTFTHAGPLTAGAQAGGTGVINVSGNAIYNCTNTSAWGFWFGEGGTGVLNMSGSGALTLDPSGSGIELGHLATGNGITNLLGGNLTLKTLAKGPGTGTLNFNGGKLTANAASTTFVTGLTGAYVYGSGGTIDNGGNAITIPQAFLAPTGGGVTATGLTVSGGGLIDTPLVNITGDGTGATAVAEIDASGNLTGITITNPGVGYTTATVTLSGGGAGNTAAVGGAAAIAPNVSGGLTFTGSATTILAGANTYTGNTVVSSGSTLAVAASGSLAFKPGANGVSNKVTGAGTASFDGTFTIDLSGAAAANGNTWTLVDVAAKSYNATTFSLTGFTESSNVWTKVDGNKTWTFKESDGVLSLAVSAGGGFSSWISGFGIAAGEQGRDADPDHDGINNLLEYALGGNPNSANSAIVPTGSKSGSNYVFSFSRADLAAANGDALLELQYGNALSGWTTVAVPTATGTVSGVGFVVSDGSPGDTVTATIPVSGAVKFFARLRVTAP